MSGSVPSRRQPDARAEGRGRGSQRVADHCGAEGRRKTALRARAVPQAVAFLPLVSPPSHDSRVELGRVSTPEKIRFADLCGERGIWQRWSPGICPQRMPDRGRPPINGPPPHRRCRSHLPPCIASSHTAHRLLSAGPATPRICPGYACQRFP